MLFFLWFTFTFHHRYGAFSELFGEPTEENEIQDLLKGVQLWDVRHKQSGQYSGGMRRRLSVAIASVGSPKVMFLDEPTTGMDPLSRQRVWNMIQKIKKNRAIILTTHSMEEADALGDRIGIMSEGKLVAIGSSLHLKSKFGAGYRIKRKRQY